MVTTILKSAIVLGTMTLLSAAQAQKVAVTCCGTSITHISQYPQMLQILMAADADTVVNRGTDGSAMNRHSSNTYWNTPNFSGVFSDRPDVIVIEFGINDCLPGLKSTDYEHDYRAMIDTFLTIKPKSGLRLHPLICTVLPTPDFKSWETAYNDTLTNVQIPIIKKIAASYGFSTIDFNTLLKSFPQYFTDGVHPAMLGPAADSMSHCACRQIEKGLHPTNNRRIRAISEAVAAQSFVAAQFDLSGRYVTTVNAGNRKVDIRKTSGLYSGTYLVRAKTLKTYW
jgi:lysophospholipase L1-like esterase